jgi:energy-converting hydrogenase Eha subunit B
MAFKIGDRVKYEGEDIDGTYLQGEIVDIAKNSRDIITSYFAVLESGLYVQFKPHNLSWRKIDETSPVT